MATNYNNQLSSSLLNEFREYSKVCQEITELSNENDISLKMMNGYVNLFWENKDLRDQRQASTKIINRLMSNLEQARYSTTILNGQVIKLRSQIAGLESKLKDFKDQNQRMESLIEQARRLIGECVWDTAEETEK